MGSHLYNLYAASSIPGWTGKIASERFHSIEDAEVRMREWALFGVDAYCNDPDTIWIADAEERPLKYWSWRSRSPCVVSQHRSGGDQI